ncbi:zinc/iron-chelating domain-containing protein [Rhodospirillum rubrum]|uniref:YkgJ family cysteine cluster protein n=1 Tax=Rhodospirillum rubrum TaxID=1085 RepID=UPI0019039B46|nr:YkgJ family cysteine cluster protein [Rhodospirillum rubrum]MBK1664451.1 zinc/iron-chelating domain-containing protein [Rhodospirillum rubrum]MBK1676157.1 zinc/iron-chelating domain-containing protein [Rhodospirillum rubrum]
MVDCRFCGACCAFSRFWPVLRPSDRLGEGGIPPALTTAEGARMLCEGDRCVALQGTLGERVSCAIYANRPEACQSFIPGGRACHLARQELGFEVRAFGRREAF